MCGDLERTFRGERGERRHVYCEILRMEWGYRKCDVRGSGAHIAAAGGAEAGEGETRRQACVGGCGGEGALHAGEIRVEVPAAGAPAALPLYRTSSTILSLLLARSFWSLPVLCFQTAF
jgi:hypothetical protein